MHTQTLQQPKCGFVSGKKNKNKNKNKIEKKLDR
jgi:hypothetical protein